MKNEIRICSKTNASLDEIRERLLNLNFFVQEEFQLVDIYMIDKKEEISLENFENIFSNYVLIREFVGKKSSLMLKRKETNEKGDTLRYTSTNCPIVSCNDAYSLMTALGYEKLLTLNVHNIIFSNGKNEICVQDVENLGVYIKMRQSNQKINHNNGDTVEDMISNLMEYDLPLDESDFMAKKSYDMFKKIIKKK